MAVLTAPTLTNLATEALKRGGRRNPTAAEITDASDEHLKSVMTQIQAKIRTHELLKTVAYDATVKGQRTYAVPTDLRYLDRVILLDGPDDYRGTAQTGGATSITLAAAHSSDSDATIGNKIQITGGTGPDQAKQIVGYDDGTKVATVDSAWDTNPDSTSTYLLAQTETLLFDSHKHMTIDQFGYQNVIDKPWAAVMDRRNILLSNAPDKIYGLEIEYYVNLMDLDLTGTLFVNIITEWYHIFLQGIAVEVMQRFDDERYNAESSKFRLMLDDLVSEDLDITQVQFRDV